MFFPLCRSRHNGKKVPGRKRGLAVDVLGLVIAVVVVAASMHDNAIGNALLDRVAAATLPGSVQTALVDQGFKSSVVAHGATHGIDVKIVARNPAEVGFVPQPKRWVVERTYGRMSLHRRLVRDYEHDPASSESRVYWAMTDVMTRRLTLAFCLMRHLLPVRSRDALESPNSTDAGLLRRQLLARGLRPHAVHTPRIYPMPAGR
ncbi:transposase [Nonomuraea sp. 3N208]|uniref:transposase n=1 Tax=Nonomuraea sp. 3N208 TaxID=3457421 RepID=UPI003FD6972F